MQLLVVNAWIQLCNTDLLFYAACNCSISNSILDTCDADGVCQCQPGSTGTNCDICLENHFQGEEGCTGTYLSLLPNCMQTNA